MSLAVPALLPAGCFDSGTTDPPPLDPNTLPSCGEPEVVESIEALIREPELIAGCERYLGAIAGPWSVVADISVLRSLRWIDGGFGMRGNPQLTSLHGLERVEHLGSLYLDGMDGLEDLTPLARLRTVDGRVEITNNPALTSLHGLEGLEEAGRLEIRNSPELRDVVTLETLASLRRVEGDVVLRNFRPEVVDAFLSRVDVGGTTMVDGELVAGGSSEP